MEDTEKKHSWAEILKHPTANMIIGFLLTGVIGTSITNYYSMKQREEKRHIEMVETNKKSVAILASLNAERLAQAEMLLTALERGNKESIQKLIKMYAETELRWKTESSPALMAARQVLPNEKYYRFREYMENEYRKRFLVPIGLCLSQAEQAVNNGSPVAEILTSCKAREYLKQAGLCNTSLLDTLYEMAKGTIDDYSSAKLEEEKQAHKKRIAVACAPIDSPSLQ